MALQLDPKPQNVGGDCSERKAPMSGIWPEDGQAKLKGVKNLISYGTV